MKRKLSVIDLKCCGNCDAYQYDSFENKEKKTGFKCGIREIITQPFEFCFNWSTDGLTEPDRRISK